MGGTFKFVLETEEGFEWREIEDRLEAEKAYHETVSSFGYNVQKLADTKNAPSVPFFRVHVIHEPPKPLKLSKPLKLPKVARFFPYAYSGAILDRKR